MKKPPGIATGRLHMQFSLYINSRLNPFLDGTILFQLLRMALNWLQPY